MKTYRINFHDNGTAMPIEGETILAAIEKNFDRIIGRAELGNAAGYQLDKVVVEYRPEALGGKGGGALTITAHGSDFMRGYDPRNDAPKTTTLWIDGVTPDELPKPDITTFDNDNDAGGQEIGRSPYEAPENLTMAWGDITALLDEVGQHHCRQESVLPTVEVRSAYHNVDVNFPFRYLELLRQKVARAVPKADSTTKKMLNRVDELALYITEHTKEENAAAVRDYTISLYHAQAAVFLRAENKITALAYYRNKARLSGRELGEKVGISDRQIRNYERPRGSSLGDANHDVLRAIADVLGVKPSQLVDCGLAVLVDPVTGEES